MRILLSLSCMLAISNIFIFVRYMAQQVKKFYTNNHCCKQRASHVSMPQSYGLCLLAEIMVWPIIEPLWVFWENTHLYFGNGLFCSYSHRNTAQLPLIISWRYIFLLGYMDDFFFISWAHRTNISSYQLIYVSFFFF